jgi:signal transduction histidine kinase
LETGEIELYSQWVDIADIVQQAVKIVQQEFNTRGLSLAVEIEPELPQLYIDSRRILQVLLNLLSNAYKYTNKGGAIVNVGKTEQEIQISVRDTGIGIQKSDQAHLFTRFFRAADQAIQKAGGTGLGLSISKGMVELHGGNLTFESEYRKGTTFNLALPLDQVKVPQ